MFHSSKGLGVALSMELFQDSIVDSFLNCHLMSLPLQRKFMWEETGILFEKKERKKIWN